MRYGFINNFAQALSGELAQGATSMTLDDNGALLDNASAEMVYTLTLFDVTSGENEIVYVTAADGNELTVERGQEGTTDRTWPTGTQVEMRLTAGVLESFSTFRPDQIGQIIIGQDVEHYDPDWFDHSGIAIGRQAVLGGTDSIVIGRRAEIDNSAYVDGDPEWMFFESVVIGANATINGDGAEDGANFASVVVGGSATARGHYSVVAGYLASGEKDSCTALGARARAEEERSTAIGYRAMAEADGAVALGYEANASVVGGLQVGAVSYLAAEPLSGEGASRSCAMQSVLSTAAIDLSSGAAVATLALPADTLLMIDAIDIVIVEAAGAGGDPELIIGPDDQDPDAYLAATAVTKTSVGGRETHAPLVSDGVSSMRVAVDAAGAGTYKAKIVFRGYVVEV